MMPRPKRHVCRLLLLLLPISVAVGDDLFGMRLTTETLKTKERSHYRFHYFVRDDSTGDYKTQEEIKEGDSVHGSYTLAEPNGDLRTVTYKAGPGTGFEAKVDVRPSASPMKQTIEEMARSSAASTVTQALTATGTKATSEATTPEPTDKDLPGGVIMDILKKPQTTANTEMQFSLQKQSMKFSLNTDFITEPVTAAVTAAEGKTAETTDTSPAVTRTTFAASPLERLETTASENAGNIGKLTEDPIRKEIDDAENSMPKLPEVVFPDNKTHFKFHKDPEEALLDERITQIARQLAETSLRREYEERKLGHFIPISVTSVEPSTASHLSKSLKLTKEPSPKFRPLQQPSLQMFTQVKLVPQYIYGEGVFPKFFPANQRLPVVQTTVPFSGSDQWEQQTYETVTNIPDILKMNKTEPQVAEINQILGVTGNKFSTNYGATDGGEPVSVVPIHAPTFVQFFSPYVVPTGGNYVTQTKSEPQLHVTPVTDALSKAYTSETTASDGNFTKS